MPNTEFTLFYSNTCGIANNQFYPHEIQINSENDLKTAVSHDHVCARYQNGKQLDTAALKQLCSTNTIYAEKKYKIHFLLHQHIQQFYAQTIFHRLKHWTTVHGAD